MTLERVLAGAVKAFFLFLVVQSGDSPTPGLASEAGYLISSAANLARPVPEGIPMDDSRPSDAGRRTSAGLDPASSSSFSQSDREPINRKSNDWKIAEAASRTKEASRKSSNASDTIGLLKPGRAQIKANPFRAGRSMTMSRHGIVASSHGLASQAGLDILRDGGNAIDAAVAAGATLAVVEPMMTGMGGDVFILYYEAKSGKVYALNGSGRSPKALSREYFANKEEDRIEPKSWEAVTVPGAVDAWVTAVERFGNKSMSEVLAPAIRYAEEGFPVTEIVGGMWKSFGDALKDDAMARRFYLPNDKAPEIGSVFKHPALAETFRQIAAGGSDAFYRGPIAEEIVRYAQETGGYLTLEDFAEHRSEWVEPISTNYRGYDVYQCPPNGQGLAVLIMLNILEGYDLASMGHGSPELLHLMIEAKKLAYADVYKYVADPASSDPPLEVLLSKAYAKSRAALIDAEVAMASADPGIPTAGDTIYLCTIDSEGNAVSFINSLYAAFGANIVGGETGILMQNRGYGFSMEKGHFNEYAPGKRPFHTIIPGMVLKDGELYMTYGLMGGSMQPQGHVQFLTSHLDFGLSVQEAADTPRWRHEVAKLLFLEHGLPTATSDALKAKGHAVRLMSGSFFGGAQAIMVDPKTGTYMAASDPRKDGVALGY